MRNDGPKISPLTFFIHLSCFGRVVRVFLTKKSCLKSCLVPSVMKNQVQKPETPEKILKGVSHNCQRLKEKMDSFRTPKVGIEPPTTEPTDSTAKAGAQASTTSKTLGEMKAPFWSSKSLR